MLYQVKEVLNRKDLMYTAAMPVTLSHKVETFHAPVVSQAPSSFKKRLFSEGALLQKYLPNTSTAGG